MQIISNVNILCVTVVIYQVTVTSHIRFESLGYFKVGFFFGLKFKNTGSFIYITFQSFRDNI